VGDTNNPFDVLGLRAGATADEIRAAYRALAKKHHPDQFTDPDKQRAAQERMITLNLAYEDALRIAASGRSAAYAQTLSMQDALLLARKMLSQQKPESALRHLLRASSRDARWYSMQGEALMQLEDFEAAHRSYREAVRREPANIEYRRGALDAAVALKKSQTIAGRIQHILRRRR